MKTIGLVLTLNLKSKTAKFDYQLSSAMTSF